MNELTDDEYINIVRNLTEQSQYTIDELTGGNVQLTCSGGTTCKSIMCKLVLYFGYKNGNNRKHEKEISIEHIEIYLKALHLSLLNKRVIKNGEDTKELLSLIKKPTINTKPINNINEQNQGIGLEVVGIGNGIEVKGNGSGIGFGIGIGTNSYDPEYEVEYDGRTTKYKYSEIPS